MDKNDYFPRKKPILPVFFVKFNFFGVKGEKTAKKFGLFNE
jgi:hypothetical protein